MEKAILFLKKYAVWNIVAFLAQAASPMEWTNPFGCAFMASAGYGGLSAVHVFPGAILGAVIGNGGLAGVTGGLLAYLLSALFRERIMINARAAVSLIALLSCLIPSVLYHMTGGTYDLTASALCALAAMAACPSIMPFVSENMFSRLEPNEEERVALFLMIAVCLCGITMVFLPVGYFLSGLFALVTAFGGIKSALIGALTGGAGLLLGGGGAHMIALLFLCSAAAGMLAGKNELLQSAMFLIGIPLSVYFGVGREGAFLLSASAVFPWIPRAYKACFLRYMGLFSEKTHVYLAANCARRHASPAGIKVCGDTGAVQRLPGGRLLFMLADGMGTGENARKISEKALESTKNLFYSPLSDDENMKCVNALCSDAEKELHTTLDICHVDLVTGRVKFFKNGAEPTWIIGKRGVIRIEGEALPLGVLQDAPAWVKAETVEPGDILFMATDGLIHALGGADNAECTLMTMKNLTASALCAEIMKKARSAQPHLKKDDMSAMCARIHLKNPSDRQRRFLPLPEAEMKKAG